MVDTAKESARNRRDAGTRWPMIIYLFMACVSLVGLVDATYLTVMHLTGDDAVCGSSAGCAAVLSSRYATIGVIPTAALGILAYFAAFSAAVLAAFGYARARSLLALVVGTMFLVTLALLYLQAFVLHAFCPFCLLSAALTFFLAGIAVATSSLPQIGAR